MNLEICKNIAKRIEEASGRAYYVGGFVRDRLLDLEVKDVDIEVFGISPEKLKEILEGFGKVDTVGASFAILKLSADGHVYDFSLPRKERKTGNGHKNFIIEADPFMALENAAKRRDLTINALMQDVLTEEILDFYGGKKDIENKVLKCISRGTFIEDSLRVLRACQFAARFNFTVAEDTVELCRSVDLTDLPADRIKEELFKLLLKGEKPSLGIKYMHRMGVIDQLFPDLIDLPASELIDRAVKVRDDCWSFESEEDKLIFMLAIFLAPIGVQAANKVFDRLGLFTLNGVDIRKQVLLQIEHFNKPLYIYNSDRAVFNHLAQTGLNLSIAERLVVVDQPWVATQFLSKCGEYNMPLDGSKIKPLIKGSDLLTLGLREGKELGDILRKVFEAQLDCKINSKDEALTLAKTLL